MRLILLLLLCLCFNTSYAQLKYDDLVSFSSKDFKQEKVYLQFDKNFYSPGDDIWIKGFVFNGYKLSSISKKLYIELLDQDLQVRDRQVLLLQNGSTNTTLTLDKNLAENIYYIRAYTALTSNTLLEKKSIFPIKIYNSNSEKQIVRKASNNFQAKVFVEGGKGFVDKSSKFVVRLFNQFNPDLKWKANVYNKQNNIVATVNVLDANLGVFQLKPIKNEYYSIKLTTDDGKEQTIQLSDIFSEGVSLDILSNQSGFKFIIKSNNSEEDLNGYKIVATNNNKIIYTADINSPTKEATNFLDNKIFDDYNGVVTFSLFDRNQNKINERLVFLHHSFDKFKINPSIEKRFSTNKRELNEIVLPEDSKKGYFLSVKDEESQYNDNLLSAIWYSLDFESYILNPKNYFNQSKGFENLDALLLTEKWERFLPDSNIVPEDANVNYYGKLTHKNKPLGNVRLNLFVQNNNTNIAVLQKKVDDSGSFVLDNMNFDGELKIIYDVNKVSSLNLKESDINISLTPSYKFDPYKKFLPVTDYVISNSTETNNERSLIIKDLLAQKIENETYDENAIKLKEVFIEKSLATKRDELNEKLSKGLFKDAINERIFDFINDPINKARFISLETWVLSNIPGVTVRYVGGFLKFFRRGGVMKIFLDEMEMQDAQFLVDRENIAMIKVFSENSYFGNAIAIYTNYGKDGSFKKSQTIKGYNTAKEYLSVENYETNYMYNKTDTRKTLLWKSIYGVNKENSTVKFFSNDKNENINLEFISFDNNGNIQYYSE